MRACQPIRDGYVERDGIKIFYEVFGTGEPTVLLLPTWSLLHSRQWKMQVPYLARHCRVVTFDGRGNGRSDRPTTPEAYAETEFMADAIAVMEATQTERAVIVGFSLGAQRALLLAANHPERVDAAVFVGPTYPGGGHPRPERTVYSWEDELGTDQGWAKYNKHYWLRDYQGFVDFFLSTMFPEPHSTKPIEDGVGWALETTGETLALTYLAPHLEPDEALELARRVRCPVLVVHGDRDGIADLSRGIALAEHTGGQLVGLEGSGHAPHLRDPVKINLLLRDFVKPAPPPLRWVRGKSRRKRALYISSPIGLGHAQRDVAIADELRKMHPDIEIDWLAQHPVTKFFRLLASGFIPRAHCLPTNQATSRASRRSTICTASRRSDGWMRSCCPTSWCSTTWYATSSTTFGSVTRPGSSTITYTRTQSRSMRRTSGSPTSSAGCRCRMVVIMKHSLPPTTTRR